MLPFGKVLPRTILALLAVLLGVYAAGVLSFAGRVLAWGPGTGHLAVMAHQVTFTRPQATSTRDVIPSVTSLTATPLQVAPLETVTFATTFFNGGLTRGPYRATLQLLPEQGGQLRSLSQNGFMLRHNQQLTLYWEWRAGASLPAGLYKMRVLLGPAAKSLCVVTSYTTSQRLTIVLR
jgi:hypothetical protein